MNELCKLGCGKEINFEEIVFSDKIRIRIPKDGDQLHVCKNVQHYSYGNTNGSTAYSWIDHELKEEEFKGFDYDTDKSSRLENKAVRDRVISNGIDFVNIAKLIAKAFSNKTVEEQLKMKPSEILPLVFDDRFFENDLDLPQDQVMGFLIFIDKNMKTSSLLKQDMQFQLIDYLINRSKEFKNGQVN